MKALAVIGIHTNIGKTIVSAVLTEALQADYWKPVQAGGLDFTDTMQVSELVSNSKSVFHPERFLLKEPMSPHAAAALENLKYELTDLTLPTTPNLLLVETAGGVMSPVTDSATVIDFLKHYALPAVLVVEAYLGSINHTLLCLDVLAHHKIDLKAVVFNGTKNQASEEFIIRYAGVKNILHVDRMHDLNAEAVKGQSEFIKSSLQNIFSDEFEGKR